MKKIIAVDFDGTLCSNDFPKIGELKKHHKTLHEFLRDEKKSGAVIILWTCRAGERLKEAVEACKKWDIPIDYVNENDPELIELFGGDTRKIVASLYIDDKAITHHRFINDKYIEL